MYDLIVVGGSAIGLYLAAEFQKKGNSVLVLERKKKIGEKACSGLVSGHIFDFMPNKDSGFFVEKVFSGVKIWIENKKFDFYGKAWLLHRQKFDEYLFQGARKEGVEIKLGEEVVKIKEHKNFVKAITKNGEVFHGKILAGCDGVTSKTAREAGLPKQNKLLLGVIIYQQPATSNQQPAKGDFPELFFSKQFPGFFAWRIPYKNFLEYGIALEPKYKPKEVLEKWLKTNLQQTTYNKQLTTNNLQFQSALIPFFPLERTTTRRIFLCGDSAGQIKSYTGGGLVYGLTCAKIAAEVINPQNPNLSLYEKKWRQELMKEIRLGNFVRKCYRLPNFIKKAGLSFLKNFKKIDQDKPSTIFKI